MADSKAAPPVSHGAIAEIFGGKCITPDTEPPLWECTHQHQWRAPATDITALGKWCDKCAWSGWTRYDTDYMEWLADNKLRYSGRDKTPATQTTVKIDIPAEKGSVEYHVFVCPQAHEMLGTVRGFHKRRVDVYTAGRGTLSWCPLCDSANPMKAAKAAGAQISELTGLISDTSRLIVEYMAPGHVFYLSEHGSLGALTDAQYAYMLHWLATESRDTWLNFIWNLPKPGATATEKLICWGVKFGRLGALMDAIWAAPAKSRALLPRVEMGCVSFEAYLTYRSLYDNNWFGYLIQIWGKPNFNQFDELAFQVAGEMIENKFAHELTGLDRRLIPIFGATIRVGTAFGGGACPGTGLALWAEIVSDAFKGLGYSERRQERKRFNKWCRRIDCVPGE